MDARAAAKLDATLEAVSLVALAVWLGGMATLGAVAAPLVFGIVPAPASADAMTAVFRRFDGIAVTCAALVLVVEAAHAALRKPIVGRDLARAGLAVGAAALAIVEAVAVSPHIARLHAEGAVRGSGAAGLELDRVHHLAESLAKTELGMVAVVLVLHAFRARAFERAGVRTRGD